MYIADRRQIDRHLILCSQKLNLGLWLYSWLPFYDTLYSEISVQVSLNVGYVHLILPK